MKLIAKNFKGLYKEIILGPLFKLFEAVLELMVPLVVADIIDTGIRGNNSSYILQRGLLLVLIAVLSVAAAMICQYYAARAAGHFGRGLRNQLFSHVLNFSGPETDEYGTGGLITRLTNDVNQIQTGVNMSIRLATRAPFLAIGSIVMALLIDWKIGLIFLLSTPLIVWVLYAIMKRTVPSYGAIQSGQGALSRLAGENLEGARVIRAFSRQNLENEEFEQAANDLTALTVRVGKISAALAPVTGFIINLAIIGIVWAGAGFVFKGTMQPGTIIALVSYMNQTLLALVVAANLIVLFTRAAASTKRVAQVLDTSPAITSGPGAVEVEGAPALCFNQVDFAYHTGASNALEQINFTLQAGKTLGVIGGTGSGKTTLTNLMQRFYDVTAGEVLLFGVNVKEYTLPQLRQIYGIVPQTASVLGGTIRYNMRMAAPNATEEDIWHALEVAQAAEFVRDTPDGLDTVLEEGGKNLSGGQRQRLTIARALVRKPRFLLLDDSASALDYATDAALRKALAQDAAQQTNGAMRTTMIISQRASTIKNADLILVLDDGRIAASGTHEQLLQSCGVYKEICVSQGLAAYAEEGLDE